MATEQFDLNSIKQKDHRAIVSALLNSRLDASALSKKLGIGKSTLYSVADRYLGEGFIAKRREQLKCAEMAQTATGVKITDPKIATVIPVAGADTAPQTAPDHKSGAALLSAPVQSSACSGPGLRRGCKNNPMINLNQVYEACLQLYYEGKSYFSVHTVYVQLGCRGGVQRLKNLVSELVLQAQYGQIKEPPPVDKTRHPHAYEGSFADFISTCTSKVSLDAKHNPMMLRVQSESLDGTQLPVPDAVNFTLELNGATVRLLAPDHELALRVLEVAKGVLS